MNNQTTYKLICLFIGLILVTSFKQKQQVDKDLVGTWLHTKNGKAQYFRFFSNGTFELSYNGKEINKDYFEKRGVKYSLTYQTEQATKPKKLLLNMTVFLPDTTMTLVMTGVYEILDNQELKIDLTDNINSDKTNFTNETEIFVKTKDFSSVISVTDGYIFTRIVEGEIVTDTILINNEKFKGIDTTYNNIIKTR